MSYWLKAVLVKVLIYRKRRLDLKFKRRISLKPNAITIRDDLQGSIGDRIETLSRVDFFTTIHMGSSRYFVPNELNYTSGSGQNSDLEIDISQLKDGVTLERTITFK